MYKKNLYFATTFMLAISASASVIPNITDFMNTVSDNVKKLVALQKKNSQALRDKSITPSEYSPSNGSGMVQNGVNLFSGQPSQSIPLFNISHGNSSWPLSLNYGGGSYILFGQNNLSAPSGVVGTGWDLSSPGVMVNNMGTTDFSDDIFYCNLGPYGGGQIVLSTPVSINDPVRLMVSSNPQIKVGFTVANDGLLKDQIIAWTFIMPDGHKLEFGSRDAMGETNVSENAPPPSDVVNVPVYTLGGRYLSYPTKIPFIRYQLSYGTQKGLAFDKGKLFEHNLLPYRWDLRQISTVDSKNVLKFAYEYTFAGRSALASNWQENLNTARFLTNESIDIAQFAVSYIREGYLKRVWWEDDLGRTQDALRLDYQDKPTNVPYVISYSPDRSGLTQPLFETRRITSVNQVIYRNAMDSIQNKIEMGYLENRYLNDDLRPKYLLNTLTYSAQNGRPKTQYITYEDVDKYFALKKITQPDQSFVQYNYTPLIESGNSEEVVSVMKNISGGDASLNTEVHGRNTYIRPQIQCVGERCFHFLKFNDADNNQKYTRKILLNIYKNDGNQMSSMPIQVFSEHDLLTDSDLGYDLNFVPLDDENFMFLNQSEDHSSTTVFFYHFNEKTQLFERQSLSYFNVSNIYPKINIDDATSIWSEVNQNGFGLKNVYPGKNIVVFHFQGFSNWNYIRILKKDESKNIWSWILDSEIEPISTGDSEYGEVIRGIPGAGEPLINSAPLIWTDDSFRITVTGDRIFMLDKTHEVLLGYGYNQLNGRFESLFKSYSASNGICDIGNVSGGLSFLGLGWSSVVYNRCYPMNFNTVNHVNYINAQGDWLIVGGEANKTQMSLFYRFNGLNYQYLGYSRFATQSIYYADDEKIIIQQSPLPSSWTNPNQVDIKLLKIRAELNSQTVGSLDNDQCSSGSYCLQGLQTVDLTENAYRRVKLIPGGFVLQTYKLDGVPLKRSLVDWQGWAGSVWGANSQLKITDGFYDFRVFKYKDIATIDAQIANPNLSVVDKYSYVDEINDIKILGTAIDPTVREIDYSPQDGLIRVTTSNDVNGDAARDGLVCEPYSTTVMCDVNSSGYYWNYEFVNNQWNLKLSKKVTDYFSIPSMSSAFVSRFDYDFGPDYLIQSEPNPSNGDQQQISFQTYRGLSYFLRKRPKASYGERDNIPVVSEIIQSNPVAQIKQQYKTLKFFYPGIAGYAPECNAIPAGIGTSSAQAKIEFSPNSLTPQFNGAYTQICTQSGTTSICEPEKTVYKFNLQKEGDAVVYNTAANGSLFNPDYFKNGTVDQVIQCGRSNEFRGVQQNIYTLYSQNNWPNSLVVPRADSSVSYSLSKNGLVQNRTETKAARYDDVSGQVVKTRTWSLNSSNQRDLMIDSTRLGDYNYTDSEQKLHNFRVPLQSYRFFVKNAVQEPSTSSDWISASVQTSRTGFNDAMLGFMQPQFDLAQFAPKNTATPIQLKNGYNAPTPHPDNNWGRVNERTQMNGLGQVLEQRSIPRTQAENMIYSSFQYEGPRSLPVAQFSNAPLASVYYFDGENNSCDKATCTLSQDHVYSGDFSAKIQDVPYGPTGVVELPVDRVKEGYVASVWMYSEDATPPVLSVDVREENGTILGESKVIYSTQIPIGETYSAKKWQRYELRLTEAQLKAQGSFTVGGNKSWLRIWAGLPHGTTHGLAYVDQFVGFPAKAVPSLKAFDGYGRVIDATGSDFRKMTYEYNAAGEPLGVRDEKGRFFEQSFKQDAVLRANP